MQSQLNKSKKIILETRQEHKTNKTGFTNFSLSSKKFYIKPQLHSKHEIEMKP